jgi:hypothetical protein
MVFIQANVEGVEIVRLCVVNLTLLKAIFVENETEIKL